MGLHRGCTTQGLLCGHQTAVKSKPVDRTMAAKEDDMSNTEFFQTRMGHKFYSGDVPRIATALERIADRLGELAQNDQPDEVDLDEIRETDLGLQKAAYDDGIRTGIEMGINALGQTAEQGVPRVSRLDQEAVLDHVSETLQILLRATEQAEGD